MRACEELLQVEGILTFRMNAGDRFIRDAVGKVRHKIRGHEAGTADLLAFPIMPLSIPPDHFTSRMFPIVLWIECKSSDGKPRPAQEEFCEKVLKIGHYYLLVDDAAQLQDWLKRNNAKGVR